MNEIKRKSADQLNYVALAGGVGGAKLAHGLAALLPPEQLTIVVNTGDDMQYMGLQVCPDVDTVLYTLSGWANTQSGWGVAGDTFNNLGALAALDVDHWFRIGDKDLATHMLRTLLLESGLTLTQVTAELARRMGIAHPILPMSDAPYPTLLETNQGVLDFQVYFVKNHCEPVIKRIFWNDGKEGQASPQVMLALNEADCVILCPSNPFVSIDPILSLKGVRDLLRERFCMALSPIIQGKALKGPAAKMFSELGVVPSAHAVADYYKDFVSLFFVDELDQAEMAAIAELDMAVEAIPSIMPTLKERKQTASLMLDSFFQHFTGVST
ncbi:MAG: 2-phospho-L-lactate transferase [Anaerolineaceae bacterium]|nr:2-phospho-L-lactate transferase [Anaerolineaceae bacterium]